jgi:lipoprotein-anchoring transpeptidase ErfK/SrfK
MKGFTIALALFGAAAGAPALAAEAGVTVEMAAAVTPNRFAWADIPSVAPVSVVVSIADQRAYVYRGQTLIAVSSVSTGKDDKPTPAGTYPILQKKADHRSNLYNAAAMPYMQRLTWDGIALHAGRNPGYAASHGCVRLPVAFAKRLFEITSVGSTVTIQDDPFVPGEDWIATAAEPDDDTTKADSLVLASLQRK